MNTYLAAFSFEPLSIVKYRNIKEISISRDYLFNWTFPSWLKKLSSRSDNVLYKTPVYNKTEQLIYIEIVRHANILRFYASMFVIMTNGHLYDEVHVCLFR